MQDNRFYKKFIALTICVALVAAGLLAYQNKWQIYDRWEARSYSFSDDSKKVADGLNLSSEGLLVFKASKTEVDDKDTFKSHCPVDKYEEASVLGCYSAQKVYVLKVDEPRLDGVEEVTAAHELLHAKFERMNQKDRQKVEAELKSLQPKVSDDDVIKLIASYKQQLGEGEDLYNEMFAVYGTQLKDVSQALELTYSSYFKNRAGIFQKYQAYNAEFKKAEAKIAEYDAKLAVLKKQKDTLEKEINQEAQELSQDKSGIDSLQGGQSNSEYQTRAQAYNARVKDYNSKVAQIKSLVDQYNQIVDIRNSEALAAKNLADSLDANVTTR